MQPDATLQPNATSQPTSDVLSHYKKPLEQRVLEADQHAAIGLLASGMGVTAVAREIGVCRETVWRWQQIPEFKEGLTALQNCLRDQSQERFNLLAGRCLDVITELVNNGSEGARLKVALEVLAVSDRRDRMVRLRHIAGST